MVEPIPPSPLTLKPRSKVWQVVRWLPTILLLLALAGSWGLAFRGGLRGVVAWYAIQLPVPVLGLLLAIGTVIYALWKRRMSWPIGLTLLLALIALWPLAWMLNLGTVAYPASIEGTTPSATVRLPADGPLRVGWGGDHPAVNYHVVAPDQRWAYDLAMEPNFTQSPNLEDYGCWGVPVVAPAAGEVVAAEDGHPDEVPGKISNNFMAPTGNHVAIKLPTDTYLLIAHLQNGSVAVKVGDQVEEGQVIGRCGNSGNTSEPHIHIHHQRQSPVIPGPAEGLPLFFRDHDGPPMPEGGFKMVGGKAVPNGAIVQHLGP